MVVKLTNYGRLSPMATPASNRAKLLSADPDVPELAAAFKALSNPNRLAAYLELLSCRGASVKSCAMQDLMDMLKIGAPTLSHHVKEMVNAGLIEVERDGKFLRCQVNESTRQRLARFFAGKGER
jgi:ArsR family transcriptional regulator